MDGAIDPFIEEYLKQQVREKKSQEFVDRLRAKGKVEILKGVEPGDTYVTKGAILLLNAIDLSQ
jgi:hypothetical protein